MPPTFPLVHLITKTNGGRGGAVLKIIVNIMRCFCRLKQLGHKNATVCNIHHVTKTDVKYCKSPMLI